MNQTFGNAYADAYDRFYLDKDYPGECARIAALAEIYGVRKPGNLVDFGCGTGGHALLLAEQGWHIAGVDRSPDMLAAARAKATAQGLDIHFVEGELGSVDLGQSHDVALMMFAVLGYQKSNRDVQLALANVRRHLKPGGIFIFDVWHGPAVLSEKPEKRAKRIALEDGEIVREASGSLDVRHNLCTVAYDLTISRHGSPPRKSQERHDMRYFFPLEIELFLEGAGFEVLRISDVNDIERPPEAKDWNMLVVARAV